MTIFTDYFLLIKIKSIMGKMKEVFQEEQESRSVQDKFLDEEWEMRVRQVQEQQRQLLNQIFESWGEVFGVKDVKSKSNEDNHF
ncbi:MAG: hypothetical protein Tp158DCM1228761_18 [Prokaryotic dsDNA virus sp.]|nr:MAG: hypothetical protein Tp158DCM1228761_18 [Prokaryotic dsDNA virus sp.]